MCRGDVCKCNMEGNFISVKNEGHKWEMFWDGIRLLISTSSIHYCTKMCQTCTYYKRLLVLYLYPVKLVIAIFEHVSMFSLVLSCMQTFVKIVSYQGSESTNVSFECAQNVRKHLGANMFAACVWRKIGCHIQRAVIQQVFCMLKLMYVALHEAHSQVSMADSASIILIL